MSENSPGIVTLKEQETVAVHGDVSVADLPQFFERAFISAAAAAEASGVEIVGPPFGYYPEVPTDTVSVEAGFPVSSRAEPHGDARPLTLPGGRAAQFMHVGPYEAMEKSYADLHLWMTLEELQPAGGMWEFYLSDPRTEPDSAAWRTQILWPVI